VTHQEAAAAAPSWDRLIEIGIRQSLRPAAYLWFIVAAAVLSTAMTFVPTDGAAALLGLGVMIAYCWLELLLSRQIITGAFVFAGRDLWSIVRLLGIFILLILIVGIIVFLVQLVIPGVATAGGFAFQAFGFVIGLLIGSRLVLLLPALSVGDDTGLFIVLRQSKPHWGKLIAIYLVGTLPTMALAWIVTKLGLPVFLTAAIGGCINAIGAIMITASICHLYANHVRSRSQAIPAQ
jgi:hypothetical protein